MKLTLEKYKTKVSTKIQKQYPESYIENGEIVIVKNNKGVPFSLEYGYSENMASKDINKLSIFYMEMFENILNLEENPKPAEYHNMYPVIRNKEFGKDESLNFIRKHYFLDLDIFVVEDCYCLFRFCEKKQDINEEKALEAAMFNINRMKNDLYQPENDLNIFSIKTDTDYAASLLLNTNFKKQIREKIGRNFLIAIPSSSWIAIAPNQSQYIPLLQEVIRLNEDPNIISSRVYRVKGDEWEYAD
jgi:uncharacterized protein YtpQ (UPF0354 family)